MKCRPIWENGVFYQNVYKTYLENYTVKVQIDEPYVDDVAFIRNYICHWQVYIHISKNPILVPNITITLNLYNMVLNEIPNNILMNKPLNSLQNYTKTNISNKYMKFLYLVTNWFVKKCATEALCSYDLSLDRDEKQTFYTSQSVSDGRRRNLATNQRWHSGCVLFHLSLMILGKG